MKTYIPYTNIESLFDRMHLPVREKDYFITDDISSIVTHDTIRPDHYSIAFCLAGNYEVELSYNKYNLTAGHIMFFKPGEVHHMIAMNNYKGYLVTFSKQFFLFKNNWGSDAKAQPYFAEGSESLLELKEDDQTTVEFYFSTLLAKEKDHTNPNRKKIVRSIIAALLFELNTLYPKATQHIQEQKTSRNKELKRSFIQLLNNHYKVEKEVSFYAEKLHVTPGHLSDVLRAEIGKSARDLIQEKLILESKVLLQGSHLSIGEISRTFHFLNDSSFIRFFKKKTGITPAKYRSSFN
tara:strand:- start:3717 stop:4598 length:882 start_codon:yes stop_codon:yes gene_type:complete